MSFEGHFLQCSYLFIRQMVFMYKCQWQWHCKELKLDNI